MNNLLIFFLSVFILSPSLAQISNIPGAANEVIRSRTYAEVEGSPYLSEDWLSGIITDRTGKQYGNILIRFDSYKNNVEVSSPDGTLIVTAELYPSFIIQVVDKVGKTTTREFVSGINPKEPFLYVERLANGKFSFFRQIKTELVEETVKTYGMAVDKKVFNSKTTYWVKSGDTVRSIKLSKSSFIEEFPEMAITTEDYLKRSKVKLKSEADFIKFFTALNSM